MKLDAENVPADLRSEDFNVITMNLGEGIPERISQNQDGSYTVILNPQYSYEYRMQSMKHAFDHVREHDWEKDDVQEVEYTRHNMKEESNGIF